jgi:hypothetical protein
VRFIAICLVCCCLSGLVPALGAAAAGDDATKQAEGKLVFVSVAGAPGDGEQALAAALAKRLAAAGLKPATAFQANVYEIQGTVRLTAAGPKQSVSIVWVVLDPDGKQLGIVHQTKQIRAGALDKRWGGAAEAAASAAAGDIVKLLPR